MNKRNLFWIIPLILTIGYLFGLYLGIPNHVDITIDYGKNVHSFTNVINESMNNMQIWCNRSMGKGRINIFNADNCTFVNDKQEYWCKQ